MVKIFLSHSWAQKQFILDVANFLGRDNVIVDNFDFEAGRKINEEIENSINTTNIFVYLASKESNESEYCIRELSIARDLIDEKKLIFCAFLIDKNLSVDDCKPWIKGWLTNYYDNAQLLARVIRRTVNELIAKDSPIALARDLVFAGRDSELGDVNRLLYGRSEKVLKAFIIAGIPHVGRKRLLREILVTNIQHGLHPSYEPILITLEDKDSIEDFIFQLNEIAQVYTNKELSDLLVDKNSGIDIAVKLLNKVLEYHERVLVDDNRCIVNPNGYYADWFLDILSNDGLPKMISLLVASRVMPVPQEMRRHPMLSAYSLNAMNLEQMTLLFNKYSQMLEVKCDNASTTKYLNQLTGYPEQVLDAVDTLKNYDQSALEGEIEHIGHMYDKEIRKTLDRYDSKSNAMQLLILISKFEFVSFDLLKQIYEGGDIDDVLADFRKYSLYETFGSCKQFIRLNASLSDYLDRYHFKLSRNNEKKLNEVTKEIIQSDDISQDLATYLFKTKKLLSNPVFVASSSSILPSLALKVIVDQYTNKEYKDVVTLANKVLYDNNRHNYESVEYAIRNWLCLAYCRLQDLKLFEEVKYFRGYTHHFLRGYYYRNEGNWPAALGEYNKALAAENPSKSKVYSKAKHEKVIVLMKLGDYGGALDLARINYESDTNNTYHTCAYFHCLVRDPHPDKTVLDSLYTGIQESHDIHKDIICKTFEAERLCFVEHKPIDAINVLEDVLLHNSGDFRKYALNSLYEICKKQQLLDSRFKTIMEKTKDLSYDKNYITE